MKLFYTEIALSQSINNIFHTSIVFKSSLRHYTFILQVYIKIILHIYLSLYQLNAN